jgi:hypothetical protein
MDFNSAMCEAQSNKTEGAITDGQRERGTTYTRTPFLDTQLF